MRIELDVEALDVDSKQPLSAEETAKRLADASAQVHHATGGVIIKAARAPKAAPAGVKSMQEKLEVWFTYHAPWRLR